jgi:hypothetical protein
MAAFLERELVLGNYEQRPIIVPLDWGQLEVVGLGVAGHFHRLPGDPGQVPDICSDSTNNTGRAR